MMILIKETIVSNQNGYIHLNSALFFEMFLKLLDQT